MKKLILLIVLMVAALIVMVLKDYEKAYSQNTPAFSYSSAETDSLAYFGQTTPGDSPVVFAPGILSLSSRSEASICFSKDGNECYFTVFNGSTNVIMSTRYEDGKWTTSVMATFSSGDCSNPCLADSDQSLFYHRDGDIWKATRTTTGWSTPVKLPAPLNSDAFDESFCISNLGNAWICSHRQTGDCNLWRFKYSDGNFTNPTFMKTLNTNKGDCYAVTGLNEDYVIWNSYNLPDGFGSGDLYISFPNGHGDWTHPKNMGSKVNSSRYDGNAFLSSDYKYLFFVREEVSGDMNIYWMCIDSLIDSLRHSNFSPYLKNQIPDQEATKGSLFSYQISDSTFIDDDGNNTLAYSYEGPLPSGLNFDTGSMTISGTPTATGIFEIKIIATDTANASDTCTFKITVSLEASIKQPVRQKIQIFPNPAKDKFTINFGNIEYNEARAEITDLSGKLVLVKNIRHSASETIVVSGLPRGVYHVNVKVDGSILYKEKLCLK
jgi:hypothetical protein